MSTRSVGTVFYILCAQKTVSTDLWTQISKVCSQKSVRTDFVVGTDLEKLCPQDIDDDQLKIAYASYETFVLL